MRRVGVLGAAVGRAWGGCLLVFSCKFSCKSGFRSEAVNPVHLLTCGPPSKQDQDVEVSKSCAALGVLHSTLLFHRVLQ